MSSLREQTRDSNKSANAEFCCPPITRKQRGSSGKPEVATVLLPGGIRGWTAYEDRDRTRAIKRWGIPQDVDAKPSIESHIPLNSKHELSLSLAQHFPSETIVFQIEPQYCTHFFPSFLAVQCSNGRIFFFLFTNLIIYIKIWHIYYIYTLYIYTLYLYIIHSYVIFIHYTLYIIVIYFIYTTIVWRDIDIDDPLCNAGILGYALGFED